MTLNKSRGVTCNFSKEQLEKATDLIDIGLFPNFSTLMQSAVRDYIEEKYYAPLFEMRKQLCKIKTKKKMTNMSNMKNRRKLKLKSGEIIEISI